MKSDDTIELQRQIAIILRKSGVSIPRIAANLRWKNRIKQSALDDKKIEIFLNVLDMLGNKHSIPPTALAKHFFSLIEITLRENIEPHKLEEVIKSKINELEEINEQIETSKKMLEETKINVEEKQNRLKIKQKDLDQFHQFSQLFAVYEIPEFSTKYGDIVHLLIDIKNMGNDPNIIISKYEESESLAKNIEKSKKEIRELEPILRGYRRKLDAYEARWRDYGDAFEIFMRLTKDGLTPEDIFSVTHILKNDFSPNKIKKLKEDIRVYGSIPAAKSKLIREYEAGDEFPFDNA